jgi:hypothetical protein
MFTPGLLVRRWSRFWQLGRLISENAHPATLTEPAKLAQLLILCSLKTQTESQKLYETVRIALVENRVFLESGVFGLVE